MPKQKKPKKVKKQEEKFHIKENLDEFLKITVLKKKKN